MTADFAAECHNPHFVRASYEAAGERDELEELVLDVLEGLPERDGSGDDAVASVSGGVV